MSLLICDNCGEEFQSGIVNVCKHVQEECKAKKKYKINDTFYATTYPPMRITVIESDIKEPITH